jgi:hypothetical protein
MSLEHSATRGVERESAGGALWRATGETAHVTEILRKLGLFSRNKAVIEISKIDLSVPKSRPGLKVDRSKLQCRHGLTWTRKNRTDRACASR